MIPAPPTGPVGLAPELARRLLADMLRIRRLEERSAQLYGEGKIRGFLHLYVGEEATATGVCHALGADDSIVATYREHGHALLRGVGMGAIMAEMYGKAAGCSRGRGGSMHLFDAGCRVFGGNAIVAGGLPLAVGLALADKLQGIPRVTACFFGDGAVAEGAFHESANLAALWQLPVLFCCENNFYAMGTALERSQAQTDLAAKAAVHTLAAETVDGMDVVAVHAAAAQAHGAILADSRPRFLELQTYRFRAHSMFDPELYRDKAEVEAWRQRDPIDSFVARLQAEGLLDDAALEALRQAAADEVEAAVAFAEAADWEPVERLADDVYTPGGRS